MYLVFALIDVTLTILNAYGIGFSVSLGRFFAVQNRLDDYDWATFIIVCLSLGALGGGLGAIHWFTQVLHKLMGNETKKKVEQGWVKTLVSLVVLILEIIATVHAWSWARDLQANGPEDFAHDTKVLAVLLTTILSLAGLGFTVAILLACLLFSKREIV